MHVQHKELEIHMLSPLWWSLQFKLGRTVSFVWGKGLKGWKIGTRYKCKLGSLFSVGPFYFAKLDVAACQEFARQAIESKKSHHEIKKDTP